MNTADLITAFLNNEMSPEQEREFLLSVAASDSQRLALKSHVMLDRVLSRQMQRASVPDGIRTTIFAAAAASLAGPLPASQPGTTPGGMNGHHGLAARLRTLASKSLLPAMTALLTVAGFGAGYYAGSEATDVREPERTTVSVPVTPRDRRAYTPAPSVAQPQDVFEQTAPTTTVDETPAERVATSTDRSADRAAGRVHGGNHGQPQTSDAASMAAAKKVEQPEIVIPKPELPAFSPDNVSSPSSVEEDNRATLSVVPLIRSSRDTGTNSRGNDQGVP